MIIHTFISPYRDCNNYLIEIEKRKFVGIDIGSLSPKIISDIVNKDSGILVGYFLTHAHGDHTVGIKEMWELYQMPIYCSALSALEINNPRKNFSIYSEEIETFQYDLPFIEVEDEQIISFDSKDFKVLSCPGHSPGCLVIVHENAAFTGDFAMADFKTPLTLPNSSKEDYARSRAKFNLFCANKKLRFYPGHGRSFSKLVEIT